MFFIIVKCPKGLYSIIIIGGRGIEYFVARLLCHYQSLPNWRV
jgi:hypothetical protein